MKFRIHPISLGSLILCCVMLFNITTFATTYYNFTVLSTLPNDNDCYASQGFAVGSSYVYSLKINTDETRACIYRTSMSDGTTTIMTNGDDGTTYNTNLGHANDMTLVTIDGRNYLYVVTMKNDEYSLVKLRYYLTTYYEVANYTIRFNESGKAMSGISFIGMDSTKISFFLKSGLICYKGSVGLNAAEGNIDVTYAFDINTSDALVNGETVPNISAYSNQGFSCYNGKVYVPLTKGDTSVVLVYSNISSKTTTGTVYADEKLSFYVKSNEFPNLFEIESCGIANGYRLWFNTNSRTSSKDTANDSVCYFADYKAS